MYFKTALIFWMLLFAVWLLIGIVGKKKLKKACERLPVWVTIIVIELASLYWQTPVPILLLIAGAGLIATVETQAISGLLTHPLYLCANFLIFAIAFAAPEVGASLIILSIATMIISRGHPSHQRFIFPVLFVPVAAMTSAEVFYPSISLEQIVVTLMLVHLADIAAGFSGKLGGTRPFPTLSPNKTTSGFLGSLVGALLLGLIFSTIDKSLQNITFYAFVCAVALLSILGDLTASYIKRRVGKKDFSQLLGPHGGVADRLDSCLLVLSFLWLIPHFYPDLRIIT